MKRILLAAILLIGFGEITHAQGVAKISTVIDAEKDFNKLD